MKLVLKEYLVKVNKAQLDLREKEANRVRKVKRVMVVKLQTSNLSSKTLNNSKHKSVML